MAPRELVNLREVCLVLDAIDTRLVARDQLDTERRKLDDARTVAAEKSRDELVTRTTTLETNWTGFFGEHGAFPLVIERTREHGKKIDRLMWLGGIGFGIVITLEVLLKGAH